MAQEIPEATWDKRFKAKHYSYRDFHTVTTLPLTEAQAMALALQNFLANQFSTTVLYVFGFNAQLKINLQAVPPAPYGAIAWPTPSAVGLGCLAREVMVFCTQDAWITIVSLNPEYLRQATLQSLTNVAPTAPQFIIEAEQFVLANAMLTFYPTYGYAIIFRANVVPGTLRVWIEGNTEGGE
jgi:hypothetical protein